MEYRVKKNTCSNIKYVFLLLLKIKGKWNWTPHNAKGANCNIPLAVNSIKKINKKNSTKHSADKHLSHISYNNHPKMILASRPCH